MKTFETVPIRKPAYNVFNLSHDVKATYNFDKLYPFFCHPVNPGETFNVRVESFMRTMPLIAPVMHNVDQFFYFFFVPFRLLWNADRKRNWQTFITGGEKGDFGDHGYPNAQGAPEFADYVLPHFNYRQREMLSSDSDKVLFEPGSLLDHMGFPSVASDQSVNAARTEPICSLPFRAYQMIWNEYFRNQNVQNEIEFSYDRGLETTVNLVKLLTMRKKCWEKDYFTSCLPWQQRGEAMSLPVLVPSGLTGTVPVTVNTGKLSNGTLEGALVANNTTASNRTTVAISGALGAGQNDPVELSGSANLANGVNVKFTGLSIGTITDLRYCLRLQQWLENNARCGSRYIEQILAHFGVVSSDSRLQRPELLGGGKLPLLFSDIPQTSASDDESVQGNLSGKGTLYGKTGGFKKYFEEHGVIIGLTCIIPRTSYSQGIPRYWTAMDKTDWYFPEFAHLSEQAVLNKELYYDFTASNNVDPTLNPDGVFGYQGRYTEYRYVPSSVHGEMRNTLQSWHLGRLFPSLPRLNSSFVECDSRVNVFALEDISENGADPFVCQLHLDIKAVRPMPKFAVPSI